MQITSNVKDVKNVIYSNKIVLVAITGENSGYYKLLTQLTDRIEKAFKGKLAAITLKIDSNTVREASIVLYIDGAEVLRQNLFLMDLKKDEELLKWSIRELLTEYKLS
jgi:hypothetical protein